MSQAVDRLEPFHTRALPPYLRPGGFRIGLVALATALALAGCNDDGNANKTASAPAENAAANQAPAAQPAVVQAAYTPPSADILYQMVAPIALYPDKLVAQILAGSTYPDQVSLAESWLAQNPGLKAAALSNAANAQPWDPSIKSLTLFPNVLGQMASNLPWTTALGKAYYNDPADVMNAIQVMRGRAYKAGSLKDSSHLKVKLVTGAAPPQSYTPSDAAPEVLVSAPVIEPPQQFIEIAPSEPSTVYVPQYNPSVVYGTSIPLYSRYSYVVPPPPPHPVVEGGFATPAVSGLIGFGVGVAVTQVISHPWGWNAWHVHWGEPGQPGNWVRGNRPPPPLARPAVVYNNQTYISNSRTVVENIHNTTQVHVVNNASVTETARPAMTIGALPGGHGPALAAGAVAATAAGGYALAQHQTVDTTKMPTSPGVQPMVRPNAMAPVQSHPAPEAHTALAPTHQRPSGRTMAQSMAQPPTHAQSMEAQSAQQAQTRGQQMAQQRAQQDQMHQRQMAQQRAEQAQTREQQIAQQRTQQDQMHQQQMAQQRAQQQQSRQQQMAQQRAQQAQTHEQQIAQQRTQQDQMHQQQMAQQRAQQEQSRQQQMAQQRARQDQMHQQQMAQQRAQAEQMRQQRMHQQAQPQSAAHPQPHEGQHGERRDRQ